MNRAAVSLALHLKSILAVAPRAIIAVVALSLAAAMSTGCIAVAVGGFFYVKGRLRATVNAPIEETMTALQAATAELDFRLIKDKSDARKVDLHLRNAANRKIHIQLKKRSTGATRVKIRVGIFGSKSLSKRILEAIKKNLDSQDKGQR